jgi:phosphoribosyl-ATP pyrophosphohydrolase
MSNLDFLESLEAIIAERLRTAPEDSYTARLAQRGIAKVAQKVGEEGVELALAAVAEPDAGVVAESADLLFHLLVVLGMRGIPFASVVETLEERHRVAAADRGAGPQDSV